MDRFKYTLELDANMQLRESMTHREKIAEQERAAREAKAPVLLVIEQIRSKEDTRIVVASKDTIFPILVVTTTESAIKKLAELPGVRVKKAEQYRTTA